MKLISVLRRYFFTVITFTFVVGWFMLLRPLSLGGPASYIIVSGVSMEPTLYDGDMVILQKQDSYGVGDIVSYKTEYGNIIHRIVEETPEGFILLGDNKEHPDPWKPGPEHILGKLWLHIPKVGRAVHAVQRPTILAAFISVFAFLIIFWGDVEEEEKQYVGAAELAHLGLRPRRMDGGLTRPGAAARPTSRQTRPN